MRPWQLIAFRTYNLTIGRTAAGARLLRWLLVVFVVGRGGKDKYAASSEFFDARDLEK